MRLVNPFIFVIQVVLSQNTSKFPKDDRFVFLSIVSQNSLRLIATVNNNSFDETLWISRLQYVLHGANNYSSNFDISIINHNESNCDVDLTPVTTSYDDNNLFVEHFVLLSCNNLLELINKNKELIVHESTAFLIFSNQPSRFSAFTDTFSKSISFIDLTSSVYVITGTFTMFEIYTLRQNDVILNSIGPTEIPITFIKRKWTRRKNLNGILIRAIATNEPQTEYVTVNGEVILIGGIGSNIFSYFKAALNFNSKIMVETVWPKQMDNGSWIGMGHLLQSHEADIAIVYTTFLPSRAAAFTVLVPHLKNALVAVFLQPPWNSVRNVYLSPFKPTLWFSLIAFLLGTYMSFRIIVFLIKYYALENSNQTGETGETASDPFIWVLSGICKQGWTIWMNSTITGNINALKIIICIIIPCTTLVISNYFAASLYKFLSAERISIKTLSDLLHSELRLVADNSSQTVLSLITHPEMVAWESEDTAEILSNKQINVKYPQFVKSDIVQGSGAFITYPTTVHLENSKNWKNNADGTDLCDTGKTLSLIPFSTPYPSGMMMSKGSVYKDLFNIQLMVLMESGIMRRFSQEFQAPLRPRCLNPHDLLYGKNAIKFSTISLSVTDLLTAFLILIVGVVFCIVVYCGEMCYENSMQL